MINLENPHFNLMALAQAVLGSMMASEHVIPVVVEQLPAGAETFPSHPERVVYRAILALYVARQQVDNLTVQHQLVASGQMAAVRGKVNLTNLYAAAVTGENIVTYCQYLREAYARRKFGEISLAGTHAAANVETNIQEAIAQKIAALTSLQNGLDTKGPRSIAELYDETVDLIVTASKTPGGLTGITSGTETIDKLTGGWQPGDLVVIAARPGMGKTTWALFMAREAAYAGKPGVFFSLEMEDKQLVRKMIATELGVYTTSQLLRGINLSPDEAESIRERAGRLRGAPLFIDETPGLSISEFRARATRLKAEYNIQFIVVDYLQLMTGTQGQGRTVEIGSITRALKRTAKELGVPILALAQLSRATEQRGGDKKPQLSDLRESGDIEQDADIVAFPYRPEYYGIKEDDMGTPITDLTYVIFAKHRNGPLDELVIGSTLHNGRYYDIESVVPAVTAEGTLGTAVTLRTSTPSEFMPDETDPGF